MDSLLEDFWTVLQRKTTYNLYPEGFYNLTGFSVLVYSWKQPFILRTSNAALNQYTTTH